MCAFYGTYSEALAVKYIPIPIAYLKLAPPHNITFCKKERKITMKHDIIIIGGGISGAVAAIAAARCGSDVLIIEKNASLGGTLAACEVGPMMTFHAGYKQAIKGITDEIIERLKKRGKSCGHIYDTTGTTYTVTPFNSDAFKNELDEMLFEAGGKVLYHTMLASVNKDGNKIKSLTVCTPNGLMEVSAKVYIDATGDATLSMMAGVDCVTGRKEDGLTQPMTLVMKMGNVDFEKLKNMTQEEPEEFMEIHRTDLSFWDKAPKMSFHVYQNRFKKAQAEGRISFDREWILVFETGNPNEAIINSTRVQGLNPTDIYEHSEAERIGRQQVRELEEFLINECPGFENAYLVRTGSQIGVRSSRQIVGSYTVTSEDLSSEKKFTDVIAHGGYPVDIHSLKKGEENEIPDGIKKFEWGTMYSVPYRALINDKVDNLITVGRCLSAEFEAVGALRVSPMAGATGHAGGVAAYLAAKNDSNVHNIDIKEMQKILLEQGAYLEM